MNSYVFKNALIVERHSVHVSSLMLLKKHNIWFPKHKLFEYQSPSDKILVFFTDQVGQQDYVSTLKEDFTWDGPIESIVKMHIDGDNVMVTECVFSGDSCHKNLPTIHDYFIKLIRGNPQISYTIHWAPHILTPETEKVLAQYNLITNLSTKVGVVTEKPTLISPFNQPIQTPFNQPSPIQTPFAHPKPTSFSSVPGNTFLSPNSSVFGANTFSNLFKN